MPKVIDNYLLERKIGSGQFGDVFKGFDKDKNRDIAVKVIRRENLKGKISELLETEIKVLRTCNNPNIIKLYDLKKTSNNFYLIMEYCNEGDLSEYLKARKMLSQDEAVEFLIQILNAFKTLVKNKIMHRDFKLANILKHDGELKIADFGFSKLLTNQDFTSTVLGSPLHMAPEVIGGNQYNNKADIWSIATVFFEMLFGKPPYTASNMVDLVKNIKKPLVIPKDQNLISPVTEDVIRKMLILDPTKRISWEQLFNHPVIHLLEDKRRQKIEESVKNGLGSEQTAASMSKFYIKENRVINHPKQISKKESINDYAMDVVSGKEGGVDSDIKGEMLNRSKIKKGEEVETPDQLKPPARQEEIKTASSNNELKEDINEELHQMQTENQKNIRIFKKNANKLLHYRNIYVFLASVAQDAMANHLVKSSEIVGYLLVKKLLEVIQWLNDVMENKQVLPSSDKWKQFTKQRDFSDIKLYVAKEFNFFTTFHKSIHNRIVTKVKNFPEDIKQIILDQKCKVEKVFSKKIKEYIKQDLLVLKDMKQKNIESQKKNWIHLDRVIDCLDLDQNFRFETAGCELFNFREYYDSFNTTPLDELMKTVQERCKKMLTK